MVLIAVFLTAVGAAMGSFIDAFAWRLHTGRDFVAGRSECEHCHHKLGPLDLIPIFSWLALGGKCRYCRQPIGGRVVLGELAMAVAFGLSYVYWPLGFDTWQAAALLGMWLVYLVLLGALLVYDLRWLLLPDKIVYPLIGLGFIDAGLRVSLLPGATVLDYATHAALGIMAMAGVYWLLYTISKGKWVGYGDVKLAIFMGLVLGWQKTLLTLMLANVIGLLVVLPSLLTKRLNPKSQIPFGPFMIIAFVIAGLFGDQLINWYITAFIQF